MSRAARLAMLLVATATITAYAPAWSGAFVFDDIAEIAENPGLRTLWPPWEPMFRGTTMPHRPLPYYTFALNYALHGLDPPGYHAVNLTVHLGNGWLVWWVARELLRRLGTGAAAGGIGSAAATLWLLHPLCTQAVAYVYQRIELLAATAILATLACFLRAAAAARPARWLAASVAASGVGMLCKEHVVAAPVVVLVVDWLAVRWRPEAAWRTLGAAVSGRPAYYACLFATPLVAIAVVLVQRERFTDFRHTLAGPLLYAANQPLVIAGYLLRTCWPATLCLDWYQLPVRDPLLLAPGIAAVGAALGLAAWGVSRARGLAVAILLFLVLLAPTSSILPVNDLMVEHRMYLPLAVVLVSLTAAAAAVGSRLVAPHRRRAVGTALVAALAVALGLTTWARCHVYRSRLVMWADVVTKAPGNPRGWQTLAVELWERGMLDRALEAVDRSLRLVPDAPVSRATRVGIVRDIEAAGPARPAGAAEY